MSAVETNSPTPSRSDSAPKLGWTVDELARSLSVSVPFLRLELKRGRLKAAHLGRRVVVLDTEVRRYLAEASAADRHWR
jgi:excisionase family DNA binding protein